MPATWTRLSSRLAALLGLALLATLVPSVTAGDFEMVSLQLFRKKNDCDCQPCPQITPAPEQIPAPAQKEPEKKEPEKKDLEKAPIAIPPLTEAPEMGPALGATGFSLASSNVGYIDNAIPLTQFRLRYDAGFGMNQPDRATYFYGTWKELSFHPHGVQNSSLIFFDPKARGPQQFVNDLDYQEVSAMLEYAINKRFSVFVDVPTRFVNFRGITNDETAPPGEGGFRPPEPGGEGRGEFPEPTNFKDGGLSDVTAGFKFALIAQERRFLTFQTTVYTPSGSAQNGLGTGHYSIEPALLGYRQLSDKLTVEDMFKVWVPIEGGPLQGNILNYGIGVGYEVYRKHDFRFVPVVEFVGWTMLNGYESIIAPINNPFATAGVVPLNHGVQQVGGQTIVNGKFGARFYFGHNDIYIGYGQALTNQRWYNDIARVEYRFTF